MFIDTHTHIQDERLDEERDGIFKALECGELSAIIEVGCDLATSFEAINLANSKENIFCSVGIHPHEAESVQESDFIWLEKNCNEKKVVAIGEIGLDYYYDHSPREKQKEIFLKQLKLSHKMGLPAIIHLRDAYEDMISLLEENKEILDCGILFHCYSGSVEMVERLLKYGGYFAFGGAITFKTAKKEEVILAVPKDRLLLETDCPYLTPVPHRGEANKPQYVEFVAKKVAEVWGESVEEVARQTRENTLRFFKKMDKRLG